MAPGSRGVGAVFVHSSGEDSGQTGDAIGEPRVPRRSRSHYLSNAPGLADQLVASRKDSAREGGSCAAYFCKVPDSRESELGLVRYGPASRVHRGVFGPFEGSFPIRIPADPDKFLAIREFHVVHGCVLLSNVPGLADQLVASQEDSVRKRGNVGGKIPEISAQPYFVGLFSRAWPCTEASLGSQDMILRTEAVGMFLMPRVLATTLSFLVRFRPVKYGIEALDILYTLVKGWSVRSSFWSGQRSGQTLVKLGQPWSNLVEFGQSSPNSWKCIPELHFKGFWATVDPSRAGKRLGQTSVNPSQTWSTLVKLGQTLGNVSLGPSSWEYLMRRALVGSDRLGSGLSRFACRHPRKSRGYCEKSSSVCVSFSVRRAGSQPVDTWVKSQDLALRKSVRPSEFGNPESKHVAGDLAWVTTQVSNRVIQQSGDPESKHVGFGNPGSKHVGDDLAWVTTQVSNRVSKRRNRGESAWVTTQVSKRGRIGLGDHPGLETETNRGRIGLGDHPGLETKFVIRVRIGLGDHPGLETETNRGRIGLGDHPGLETKFVIRVRIGLGDHPGLETKRRSAWVNRGRIGLGDHPGLETETNRGRIGLGDHPSLVDTGGKFSSLLLKVKFPFIFLDTDPHLASVVCVPLSLFRFEIRVVCVWELVSLPIALAEVGGPEFSRLLAASRPEYREFLIGLGFGPFLSIPYVSVYHPAVWCFIERFFHHTGTFHLSTCEMAVLPVDWSAILGIRFGGRAPPSEPIDGFEAREILGLADHDATEGTRRPSVRIRYLADVLRRDREEPPTELRYRQWAAYFIFSCFLGNDRSIVPTPIVGMFRDIDTLREYDWGALTYGFYIRGLRRYSRRESISFLGFWQFTVFWAFEHFPTFAPSRLPLASDPDFPLARRWDTSRIERMTTCTLLELRMTVDCLRDADIIFQPYSAALSQRPEVFRAVALSRLRLWIRTTRSWELLLGERTVRQLGDEAVVPVDPSPLMTIEDYIPRAPSDPYIAGVSAYPSLVREGVPYQEWFEQVSLGSLMSLHEVEGGRVMGGVAMDSHHIRSSGQIERLEGEGEMASMQTEATRREGEMVQMQRDLASRDAEVTRLAAAVRRLEDQLHGMGITPVTGADLSGPGQPSSSPPRDPVSRDWFFDDPSPP
uniref:Aminotransferase-like plant mobile domain-containing protein n=1 Tax=Fagus sylvatica TaxID=28930 RepID=A0A2N9HFF4_FAGSY